MRYIDNILPLNWFILLDQKEFVKYMNEIVEKQRTYILMIVIPRNNTRIVSLHFKTNI